MSSAVMTASETKTIRDLIHRDVAYALLFQCIALVGGAVIAAWTVLSASWLRGGRRDAEES